MTHHVKRTAMLGLVVLSACIFQHKKRGADEVKRPPTPKAAAAQPSASVASVAQMRPKGEKEVGACRGKNGVDEICSWRYQIDESKCPEKCTKLIAFFAGDDQSCDDHDKMLDEYAEDGYFATCVALFETPEAAGKMPFSEQSLRADAVLRHMMASPEVIARWEGGHLLVAGTGHGATVAVTTMARTEMDDGDHWKGILTTAGCFYDGVVDVFALEERLQTGAPDGGPCAGELTPARLETRYAYMPEAKARDSITGVESSNYGPLHWKMLECGSAMEPCDQDVAPGGPIEQLCATISAGDEHLCEFESVPNVDHATCATHEAKRCIEWFDKLVERRE